MRRELTFWLWFWPGVTLIAFANAIWIHQPWLSHTILFFEFTMLLIWIVRMTALLGWSWKRR